MSGVRNDCFRSSWEIVPEQRDEPLGLEVVFPLIFDQFLLNFGVGVSLLVDSGESLVQE